VCVRERERKRERERERERTKSRSYFGTRKEEKKKSEFNQKMP
jgi:hypothetical protein